ncbi:MAG: GTPase [Promethearchaeota archaeon]
MNKKPSLLIIGNSNVGKSSITRLLLPNPRNFKGKIGKHPGSTLLIKPVTQTNLPYKIIDLPGFGYIRRTSKRREEHIKKQIVLHIEKHHQDYFFGLVIINILRIEDEIKKYFLHNQATIPLSFELIKFLREFEIPILLIFNKIDKISNFDKAKNINLFVESAEKYELNLVHLNEHKQNNKTEIPYLEFSVLKKINIEKLKETIHNVLKKKF